MKTEKEEEEERERRRTEDGGRLLVPTGHPCYSYSESVFFTLDRSQIDFVPQKRTLSSLLQNHSEAENSPPCYISPAGFDSSPALSAPRSASQQLDSFESESQCLSCFSKMIRLFLFH